MDFALREIWAPERPPEVQLTFFPSPDCFVDAAQNLGKYETKVDISNKPLKNGMLELNCKLIFEAPKEVQNRIHAEACLAVIFKITDTELKAEEVKRIILA
ncbi:MAG: hypothetical protein EB045_05095, partial [Actinobacteria bacterium]|nr:hypothetical protein [Actinomycetota bacterium]